MEKNNKDETRITYIKRINQVIDFVEHNLDQDLSLANLSKKAYFSSFHFHRIFSAVMSETVNVLVNRKRIERIAAKILVEKDYSLNELADQYGFNNPNSFSRSFKKFYGMSPTEFKTKGSAKVSKIGIGTLTLEKYICNVENIKKWLTMNAKIEIKELQETKLAGIVHIGELDKIAETYQRLFKWVGSKGFHNFPNMKAITIYHDNPRITETPKVRLSACVTNEKEVALEGEIRHLSIRKGTYAVGRFEIKGKAFQKAWDSLCVWVIENGYQFEDGDYFESYLNDHTTHPEQKFIVDICIPVKK